MMTGARVAPARPDLDLFSIDSPGQHSVDTVDRLLVMIVLCAGASRRRAPGTVTSNAAMLPDELSPVIRKRTVRSPTRTVSSEGLTWRSKICCAMGPIGKRRL